MVTVFGLGFVGLTTALGFAELGYRVYGIDVDESRMETLQKGQIPFLEPKLEERLRIHLDRSLFLTRDVETAVRESRYLFYCVGTPYGKGGTADLSCLLAAIDQSVQAVEDECFRLLVIKSTVPPSTTEEIVRPYLEETWKEKAGQFSLANNPEFLREGHCWEDFIHADRIVVGCREERGRQMLSELYAPMKVPVFCVSPSTGEFIKYLSNTLLATLISYSNEMAQVADAFGDIEVAKAFQILHMDKRWGGCGMTSYVYPGCGYGGYCLPKDTCALLAASARKGFEPPILREVIETNRKRPSVMAGKIVQGLKEGAVIGILGLSFKPDSDDVRDTAAASLIREICRRGNYQIVAYDPAARETFAAAYPQLPVRYLPSAQAVYEEADVIAVATAWEEFEKVWSLGEKRVVDCRYMSGKIDGGQDLREIRTRR